LQAADHTLSHACTIHKRTGRRNTARTLVALSSGTELRARVGLAAKVATALFKVVVVIRRRTHVRAVPNSTLPPACMHSLVCKYVWSWYTHASRHQTYSRFVLGKACRSCRAANRIFKSCMLLYVHGDVVCTQGRQVHDMKGFMLQQASLMRAMQRPVVHILSKAYPSRILGLERYRQATIRTACHLTGTACASLPWAASGPPAFL
jgi:hypothetical protein